MSDHLTYSSKTSNTLFHYDPLPTISSTPVHYAPLHSTTTIYHTIYYTTTLTRSTTPSASPKASASTSRIDPLLVSSSSAPSSTQPPSPENPDVPDSESLDPSIGLTVVILAFVVILVVMTGIIWWVEVHACQGYEDQGIETKNWKPVGLGITMQPAKERKTGFGYRERFKGRLAQFDGISWFGEISQRWTSSAVAVLRAELGIDGEEGLLLPVQEKERIGPGKDQVGFEADSGRYSSIRKKS